LFIAFLVFSSILMGVLVAQGRTKSIVIILTAILFFFMVTIGTRIKYWLFLAGIFLSLFAPIMLPYGITLGELVLAALFADLYLEDSLENHSPLVINKLVKSIPFIVFAGYSLIVNLMHGDFEYWHGISFVPLLCMYVSMAMVKDPKSAWAVVRIALFVIFGFLFLLLVANITGRIVKTYGPDWRLGGQTFAFGPLVYIVYSVHLGGFVALGVPALILLLTNAKERLLFRFFYGAMLIGCFAVLVLTAARGPLIGALVAAALTILLSFRLRRLTIMLLVIGVLIFSIQPLWTLIFPAQKILPALDRLSELQNYSTVTTFMYRLRVFEVTLKDMMHNPFGFGYEYLWRQYGYIDEANIYTPLINGTGIIGFALFAIMLCQFAWTFLTTYLKTKMEWMREIATLGICTLLVELISGISAHNIIFWPKDSVVFWSILSACYGVLQCNQPKISPGIQKAKEGLMVAADISMKGLTGEND
jgi:hypothetical protein